MTRGMQTGILILALADQNRTKWLGIIIFCASYLLFSWRNRNKSMSEMINGERAYRIIWENKDGEKRP